LIGDIAYLSIAFFIALYVALPGDFWVVFALPASAGYVFLAYALCLLLFLVIYRLNNLYRLETLEVRYRHLLIVSKALFIGTGIALSVMLLSGWQFFSNYGREFLVIYLAIAVVLATITRLAMVRMFIFRGDSARSKRRLLIVGGDSAAHKVVTAIQSDRRSVPVIIGLADDYKEPGKPLFDGWKNLGRLESIPELVKTLNPDEILIAIDKAPYSRLEEVVEVCAKTGCEVQVFSDRLNTLASRIGAEQFARDLPVVRFSQIKPGATSRYMRRIVDVTIATLALIILSPLLLAVCVGIKLSSSGPVIFRQTRIGRNGRPFDFYKFRTMHVGVSSEPHRRYVKNFIQGGERDESAGEAAVKVFKITDDPRTFPFGRFIRRTSIDEFPQLFNVLKGDMGLISPRPCLPYEWESYEEWHKRRLSVAPGCTGLWQAFGRSAVPFEDMVIMDLYYIRNRSLTLDARILYKTISTIFHAKGGF
jgi:undecaprenyl-phosphate galactose phosphotransferase